MHPVDTAIYILKVVAALALLVLWVVIELAVGLLVLAFIFTVYVIVPIAIFAWAFGVFSP